MVKVDEVMCSPIASVKANAELSEIAAIMAETGVGRVLVVEDGKVLGTITAGNLLSTVSHFPDKNTREVLRSIADLK